MVEDQLRGVAERGPIPEHKAVEITLEAARVMVQRIATRSKGEVEGTIDREDNGAEVDRHVLEWAGEHAAAASARRQRERVGVAWQLEEEPRVRNGLAVTAKRGVRSVKNGGVSRVGTIMPPLPVGKISWGSRLIC